MSSKRVASAAVLMFAALAVFVPGGARAVDPLQPGDLHRTPVGQCTLNFVFDGAGANAGRVYFGTAAHCVSATGQAVRDIDNDVFGRVAYIANANLTIHDYAFIEVDADDVDRVDPSLKGHPGIPVGVTDMAATTLGDPVQISGYGTVFGSHQTTQEERLALLTLSDAQQHRVAGPLVWGDSGGPLVHLPSGTALGIVSRLCKTGCTETGPTVSHIVSAATAAGFPVTLRTA